MFSEEVFRRIMKAISGAGSVTIIDYKQVTQDKWLVKYRPIDRELHYWAVLQLDEEFFCEKHTFVFKDITPICKENGFKYRLDELRNGTTGTTCINIGKYERMDDAIIELKKQKGEACHVSYYNFNGGVNNMVQFTKEGKVKIFAITLINQTADGVIYDPKM